ncbi:hypothetical protein HPB48_001838 [Haemaphysalis longicornis]|uniref:EamA domain-containing protein n=1 Tax=Haemaphysalis longicornis TaxID=44386 RepID=A0A9J6G5K2_HAELO|nr:hypothetical protein HPB48_001838 [Haemaphysalis longicornis]
MPKRSKSSKKKRSLGASAATTPQFPSDVRSDGEDTDAASSVANNAPRSHRHRATGTEAKAARKRRRSLKSPGQLLPNAASMANGQQSPGAALTASHRTPPGSEIVATGQPPLLSERPSSTVLPGVDKKSSSTGASADKPAIETQVEAAVSQALPRQPDVDLAATTAEEKLRVVTAGLPSLSRLQDGEPTVAVVNPTTPSRRRVSLSLSSGIENLEEALVSSSKGEQKAAPDGVVRRNYNSSASCSRGTQSATLRRAESVTPANAASAPLTGPTFSTRPNVPVVGHDEGRNAEQPDSVPGLTPMALPMCDVSTDSLVATAPIETMTAQPRPADAGARGVLFTMLHCLSQAMINVLIKEVVQIPKTKLAYYVAFGYMMGNMPEAFTLPNPFGPRHAQMDLILRGLSSLSSLMLKVEALQHIAVSDLAVVYTLVPMCVTVISWYFLGEGMSVTMWTSICLCLAGIILVMRPTIIFEEWDTERTQTRVTGFMYAFASAFCLSALILLIRFTRHATREFLGFNSGLIRTTMMLLMCVGAGSFDELLDGRYLGTLVMVGKLSFCAIFFLGKALQRESGAFVTTLKFSGEIIFSVILQIAFLDLYPDVWTIGGIVLVALSFMVTACGHYFVPPSWRQLRPRKSSRPPGQSTWFPEERAAASAARSASMKPLSSGFKPLK